VHTRTCNDLAKCGSTKRKPETVQPCDFDFCSDGKRDNNETGVDCGGECRPCTEEEIEKAERGDKLTGEAITVQPYEPPNPIYIMPLLLLIMLLIAVIALHKTNLSEKMKKTLTGVHILLILSIFVLLLLTFDVPEVTGRAATEFVNNTGIPGALLSIIVSVLLVGGVTYVTLSKGLPRLDGIERYYKQSKYWAGYAVQRVKWATRKKKDGSGIEFEMPKQPPALKPEEGSTKESEKMLFTDVMNKIE
jgi:hypothetical protein